NRCGMGPWCRGCVQLKTEECSGCRVRYCAPFACGRIRPVVRTSCVRAPVVGAAARMCAGTTAERGYGGCDGAAHVWRVRRRSVGVMVLQTRAPSQLGNDSVTRWRVHRRRRFTGITVSLRLQCRGTSQRRELMTMTFRRRIAALSAAVLATAALAACSPEESADDGGSDTDAYTDLINSGPVASEDVIADNEWASKIKEAGVLRVGGTETSQLFSLLDPTTGKTRGFDAGIYQMLSHYILGEVNVDMQQVTTATREQVLESDTVDLVVATYSITPERAEQISYAGPYYASPSAILVKSDNEDIKGVDDLAGKKVATQANSTGVEVLKEAAPKAEVLALPDHAQALTALLQGNADAYVIDQTLLMNAVVAKEGKVKIVGEPLGD